MTKLITLKNAFGFDKSARSLAGLLGGGLSRLNIQKVLAAMRTNGLVYRGPRRFLKLSTVAQNAFAMPRLNSLRPDISPIFY